jgi:hypothetical protein
MSHVVQVGDSCEGKVLVLKPIEGYTCFKEHKEYAIRVLSASMFNEDLIYVFEFHHLYGLRYVRQVKPTV